MQSQQRAPSPTQQFQTRLRPFVKPKIIFGGSVVGLLILVGLLASLIAPFDPNGQDLDILSRIFYGARVSLVIALAVAGISGMIGITLGAISGYFAGGVDLVVQKAVEVMWAFPPLLFAIAMIAFLGQSLPILVIALVLQRWIPFCRVARAQALSLRSRDFIDAARSLGATHAHILRKHIVPNLMQTSFVIGTFAMATAIISEASLSFLGLGVPRSIPTWGSMLADSRAHISTSWWLPLFPGLFILVTVLGINMHGDGLRDILDPKLNRSGQRSGS